MKNQKEEPTTSFINSCTMHALDYINIYLKVIPLVYLESRHYSTHVGIGYY